MMKATFACLIGGVALVLASLGMAVAESKAAP
jgi:hypothetical protein